MAAGGCIEYEETITIEDDSGSGRIRVETHIASHVASNLARFGQYAPVVTGEEAARDYLRERNMQMVSYSRTESGGLVHVDLQATFTDINNTKHPEGGDSFSWRPNDAGGFELQHKLDSSKPPLRFAEGEEQYVDGVKIVVRMRLPRRLARVAFSSEQWTSLEGNGVTWDVPGEYVREKFKASHIFSATQAREVKVKSGPFFTFLKWALVVVMVISGYSCRLYGAAGTLFAVFIANAVALNVFEPLAGLLSRWSRGLAPYADATAFIILFFGTMLALQLTLLARMREWIAFHPNFERLVSPAVGLVSGILLSGVITTFYFLLPFQGDFIQGKLKADEYPWSVTAFRHAANHYGGPERFDPVGRFPHKYIK